MEDEALILIGLSARLYSHKAGTMAVKQGYVEDQAGRIAGIPGILRS